MTANFAPAYGLIIGAAQGIGLAFVQQLLEQSTTGQLFATYRNLSADLSALGQAYPDRLTLLPLDITDEAQIASAIAQISVDRLHLVINCIGLLHDGDMQPEKNLRSLNAENLLRYFQINSIGAALLSKHLLPMLKHNDRSVFATLSAKVGSIGDNQLGGWYGYRASKAALNMFIRTASIEYKRSCPNAILTVLHPGTTDTELSKPFQRGVPPEKLFSVDRTASQLLSVIAGLRSQDSGQFFSWDGSALPW